MQKVHKMKEELLSVGIDIGTSTTSLMFSVLEIQNISSSFSIPNIKIVNKKIFYKSDIHFTPLLSNTLLNVEQIMNIIKNEYEKAGVTFKDVSTGAVIITGDTARKENARLVLEKLSLQAGSFVVSAVGPQLECIISGKGSGACEYSHIKKCLVLNIDIGGGTSNISLFDNGKIQECTCLDIGGRLVRFKEKSTEVEYIFPKLQKIAKEFGLDIFIGAILSLKEIKKLCDAMALSLLHVIQNCVDDKDKFFFTNKYSRQKYNFKYLMCSGGVAKNIYEEEADKLKYNDIGIFLAESIKKRFQEYQECLITPKETLRATVVGIGNHSLELSGSTITYRGNFLPLKNIPVIKFSKKEELSKNLSEIIHKKLQWFQLENEYENVALFFEAKRDMAFSDIVALAHSIIEGMGDINVNNPFIIITQHDIAKVLGQSILAQLKSKRDIICIDKIRLNDGDFIDLGAPLADAAVLPVVVKTLMFSY